MLRLQNVRRVSHGRVGRSTSDGVYDFSASNLTDSSRPTTRKCAARSDTGHSAGARICPTGFARRPTSPPPRDELVIKCSFLQPRTDARRSCGAPRHVIEVMQRYTQVKAAAGEDDVALALVADAELFRLEAIVRWLDAADVRLKQRSPVAPAAVAEMPLEPTHQMEVSQ